jgi:putative oxidoreductase
MLANPWLYWLDKLYSFLIQIGSNLQSLLLLYMRLTWGHQLFLTGLNDLHNLDSLTAALTHFHFPSPTFHAYLFFLVEAIGGVLLFAGFLSRLAAIPVIAVMLSILATIHSEPLSDFRFVFDPLTLAIQRPFPFLVTALMVFVFGPGRVSIDAWIKRWLERQIRY